MLQSAQQRSWGPGSTWEIRGAAEWLPAAASPAQRTGFGEHQRRWLDEMKKMEMCQKSLKLSKAVLGSKVVVNGWLIDASRFEFVGHIVGRIEAPTLQN